MAEKLDGVMLVVFTYLDQRLTAHASLPPEKILETALTPSIHGAAAAADGAERGEAGVDSNSGSSKGRRSSMGGSQGMEPVARLLKVGWLTRWFVSPSWWCFRGLALLLSLLMVGWMVRQSREHA